MKDSKTATATTEAPKPAQKSSKVDIVALLARILELGAETLNHPQVVNKTEQGVASRVARILNREAIFKCEAHRFWTGAHVLAIVAKNNS